MADPFINPVTGMPFNVSGATLSSQQQFVLPTISDPEQTYADITRQEWERYMRDFAPKEEQLIKDAKGLTDKIVKESRDSAKQQAKIARETLQRNRERYGIALDPSARAEQDRAFQRQTTLGQVGAANRGQLLGRDIENRVLADVVNIGQGLYGSSMAGLQSAAQSAMQRDAEYRNAKRMASAQRKSNMIGLGMTIGAMFI